MLVNLHTVVNVQEWLKDPKNTYIGRKKKLILESKWHNPFPITRNSTREQVVEKFEQHLKDNSELLSNLHHLKGKTLGCWCSPEACHGNVILKLLQKQQQQQHQQQQEQQQQHTIMAVDIKAKFGDFVKAFEEAGKNKHVPAWFKPFITTIRNFNEDLVTYVDAMESKLVVSGTVSETLKKQVKDLQDDLDEQQQYSRRTCLLVHGIKEKEGTAKETVEEVEEKVREVFENKVKVKLDVKDISRTHRLGKKRDAGKPRPVIVRFLSYRQRHQIFVAKKNLKGSRITVTENLTKRRYQLLQECIKHFEKENVWSLDGRVYVNTNDGKKIFTKMDELTTFLAED